MHQQKDLKAKISVIMPVYNGEKYLQTSIESILSQTFTNFEFLILNDGSTDRTAEILKYYAGLDSRIKIFHQPNKGLVESLNRLIDLANTDIIARMDVDDIAYPKRFEKEYNYLAQNPDTVLVGCMTKINIEGRPQTFIHSSFVDDTMNRWFLSQNPPFIHSAVMMKKKALLSAGKYDKKWYTAEDYHLWIKLKRWGKITNINEVLMEYTVRASGISGQNFEKQLKVRDELNQINFEDIYAHNEIPQIQQIKNYFKKYPFHDLQKALISKLACSTGCWYVKKREWQKAVPFFLYSLQLDIRRVDSLINLLLMPIGRALLISIDSNDLINKKVFKTHWFKKQSR